MRTKDESKLQAILDYINKYFEENDCSPSLEEIVSGCGIPLSTAFRYLMALRDHGSIDIGATIFLLQKLKR